MTVDQDQAFSLCKCTAAVWVLVELTLLRLALLDVTECCRSNALWGQFPLDSHTDAYPCRYKELISVSA